VLAADYPFLDVLWSLIVFAFFVMYIWIVIMVLADNFHRNDHGGVAKAGWTLFIIFAPLLGVLVYMIARPKMTEQDQQLLAEAERQRQYVSGYSTADELAKLQQLKDSGAISAEEFESAKKKALA
jgi:hypothetical protein